MPLVSFCTPEAFLIFFWGGGGWWGGGAGVYEKKPRNPKKTLELHFCTAMEMGTDTLSLCLFTGMDLYFIWLHHASKNVMTT